MFSVSTTQGTANLGNSDMIETCYLVRYSEGNRKYQIRQTSDSTVFEIQYLRTIQWPKNATIL